MDEKQFFIEQISQDLFVYHGAVNTGVLRSGSRAVLIDCDDSFTPARLAELGIQQVERIYCTQHRRPNTAGIAAFEAEVFAPREERAMFEGAAHHWADGHNRWHLYHCRPGPLAPLADIPIAGTVGEGDEFQWGGFALRVLDTPGMSDGAVSYSVQCLPAAGMAGSVIFSGDVLYAPGQIWDIHSLQKNFGTFSDYHGFLGAARTLTASLEKLAAAGADCLVPSHGEIMQQPVPAARLAIQRIEALYRNYASVSALNFYFPHLFADLVDNPQRMQPAALQDFPPFILPVAATSFAIRSEDGALFLIDCGSDAVLDMLNAWKEKGIFTLLEGCWVTHYHDDHVDALHHLSAQPLPGLTRTPIYAEEHIAEILAHPGRFILPCISPAAVGVDRVTRHGETWQWHEFEFTSLHLPGQSYYHGGLLLRGHGLCVLFSGDSFAPTGLDDYTAGNRNFLGLRRGYRRCIDLLREYKPDLILNQHQQQAFAFTPAQLGTLENRLIEREALLTALLPWPHPNYGTDEGWIRAYPYDNDTFPGGTCLLEVRASQHAARLLFLRAEPVLPVGWSYDDLSDASHPLLDGCPSGDAIAWARFAIHIPTDATRGSYAIPFRVTWDGRYLGQVCHAFLQVL